MKGRTGIGFVLVKPDVNFKTYQVAGRDTGIATSNDGESAGQRLSVRGRIVKLPHKLLFNGDKLREARKKFTNDHGSVARISALKNSSVLFDVKIEPKEGDVVFFNYMEHYDCYQEGRFIETPEGDLLLMRYDSLIASHKLNNLKSLIPLNGYILIQPTKTETDEGVIKVQELTKNQNKIGKIGEAYVVLTGKLCNGYLEDSTAPKDQNDVKIGDRIIYKPLGAHLMEWGLHQVLFKGKKIMAIHRKNILMKD